MKSEQYAPRDNYERNFIMVKKFCGKTMVLLLMVLLFFNIISSLYLLIKSGDPFEVELLNVAFSKINLNIEFENYNSIVSLINIIFPGFFLICFINIYGKSKNDDFDSSPSSSLGVLYLFSMIELLIFGAVFALMVIFTFVFIISKPESLKIIPQLLKMNAEQIKAYKLTIALILVILDGLMVLKLWKIQSQTDFVKSVRASLTGSVPKNKGAHTYGVFSLLIGIILLCFAAVITFLYYCYREALSGLGMKLDELYVYVSFILSYVRGLIPFIIGVISFSYSNMVDETITYGTASYANYVTIGEAEDPNFKRASVMGSSGDKFIR